MYNCKTHLPPGTQDYLPQECAHKREIESAARACFSSWGYDEVETPCMEYFEVFKGAVGDFEQERMFKFSDNSGKLMVLRPDITMPLARLAATRLADRQTARMFYVGNAFQLSGSGTAGAREITQIGVELMGQSGPLADAEVIALAINALKAAGLKDFQIDIGQVQFFKGLMEEAGLTGEQAEEVRMHVDNKNMLAIEMIMQSANVKGGLRNKIMELPALYGGTEVLDTADAFTVNARSREAVAYMRLTLEALAQYGLEDYVSIDLGMVQSINYYSGIIFRGISKYLGYQLLAGGRYDGLVGEFGRELPATGFAFTVKPVLIALERQGSLPKAREIDAVVCLGDDAKGLDQVAKLRASDLRIEQYYGNRADLEAYADSRGAKSALLWSGEAGLVTVWQRGCRQ